jgi:hypothetical protein
VGGALRAHENGVVEKRRFCCAAFSPVSLVCTGASPCRCPSSLTHSLLPCLPASIQSVTQLVSAHLVEPKVDQLGTHACKGDTCQQH